LWGAHALANAICATGKYHNPLTRVPFSMTEIVRLERLTQSSGLVENMILYQQRAREELEHEELVRFLVNDATRQVDDFRITYDGMDCVLQVVGSLESLALGLAQVRLVSPSDFHTLLREVNDIIRGHELNLEIGLVG